MVADFNSQRPTTHFCWPTLGGAVVLVMAAPIKVYYGAADPNPTLAALQVQPTARVEFNIGGLLRFATVADATLFVGAHPTARPDFPRDENVWNGELWRNRFTRVAYAIHGRRDPDGQWRRARAPPTCRNHRYWWRISISKRREGRANDFIPLLVFNCEADASAWLAANPNEIVTRQWPQSDFGHAYKHRVDNCSDAYQVLQARARGGLAADVARATCQGLNASFEAVSLHTPRAWHGQDEDMTMLVRQLRAVAHIWKRLVALPQGGQVVSCPTWPHACSQ